MTITSESIFSVFSHIPSFLHFQPAISKYLKIPIFFFARIRGRFTQSPFLAAASSVNTGSIQHLSEVGPDFLELRSQTTQTQSSYTES